MDLRLRLDEHAAFLRAIARRLTSDSHAADDLVQETFVRALSARPAVVRSPRSWLATIVRNVCRDHRAADQAREQREQERACLARPDAGREDDPMGVDVLSRALQALPADYRHVLQLRYYAQRTVADIAAELGVPVATVKTRLHRALELLRADLTARTGGREQMQRMLAPLVGMPATLATAVAVAVPTLTGALLMQKVAVLFVLAVVGVLLLRGGREVEAPASPGSHDANAVAIAARVPIPEAATTAELAAAPAPERSVVSADVTVVRGVVVYAATGEGVPFCRLAVRDGDGAEELRTDAAGRFATKRAFAAGAELVTEGILFEGASGSLTAAATTPRTATGESSEAVDPSEAVDLGVDPQHVGLVSIAGGGMPVVRPPNRPDAFANEAQLPASWQPITRFGAPGALTIPAEPGPTFLVATTLPPGVGVRDVRTALGKRTDTDVAWLRDYTDGNAPLQSAPDGSGLFWCRFGVAPAVADGEAALVLYTTDGLWRGRGDVPRVRGASPEPVGIEFEGTGVIQGIVRDADGRPRPDVWVTLVRTEPLRIDTTDNRTDAAGRYRISLATPGPGVLQVTGEDTEPWRRPIDVLPGRVLEQDIALASRRIGGAIQGVITTASGERCSGCSVILTSRNDTSIWRTAGIAWSATDGRSEGRFSFEDVPLVECDVTLEMFVACAVDVRTHRVVPPQERVAFHVQDRLPSQQVGFAVVDANGTAHPGPWSVFVRGDGGWQVRFGTDDAAATRDALPIGLPFAWTMVGEGLRAQHGRAVAVAGTPLQVTIPAVAGFSARVACMDLANYHQARGVEVFADGVSVGATDVQGELTIDLPRPPRVLSLDPRVWRIFSDGTHRSDVDPATGTYRCDGTPARLHMYVQKVP